MLSTKRCAGPCGRELDVAAFPLDRGRPRPLCNDCYKAHRRDLHRETEVTAVEEHRLRAKVTDLNARVKALAAELSDTQYLNDVVEEARAVRVPPIIPRERASGLSEATCQVLASDWHIEEQVLPEQVAGRNTYNLQISQRRMERFFEAVRWGLQFNRQAFVIRDLILWLGGDFISNYIHADGVETNLLTPPEALAYAHVSLSAGIRYLLQDKQLERIVVPCNDGNHGRMTDTMRVSSRCAMSLETMLYGFLAREFSGDKRVQFIIAQGSHLYYEVYGRTIRYLHGDETRVGGGIGGITNPIYKTMARWETVRRADLTCMGHYHQRTSLSDLIINGSLIGYSPYSLSIGARFEPPTQDMTILDPRRFKGISMPLWVSDRDEDSMTTHEAQ
jgi:hypothetical protein